MATFAQFIQLGPFHEDGVLLTDAQLYHYAAGTSTLKNFYNQRTISGASTLAQPLLSDSEGIFTGYADGLYKLVLKNADGDTLYTWDNVAIIDQDPRGEGAAIASATTLVLGTDGDVFHVTGTTTIAAISGSIPLVTLIFDDILTLTHSASLVLSGGVDFLTATGTVKQFVNDGAGVWREIALGLDTVTTDIKIKKSTPALRLLGTEGSAQEYRVVESAGDWLVQRNDGTEGTPSWTTIAQFDNSESLWNFIGDGDYSGDFNADGHITGAFKSMIPKGTETGSQYNHQGAITVSSNTDYAGIIYCTSFAINTGVTVNVTDQAGRLIIIASESITLTGTATIDASGAGAPQTATSASAAGVAGNPATDQAGGGGGGGNSAAGGQGGMALRIAAVPSWATGSYKAGGAGGASSDGNGTAAAQLDVVPLWLDILNCWGGASGGSGACNGATSSTVGFGGAGGATVVLIAPVITLGSGSTINTSGGAGVNGDGNIGGGGGGGAGNLYIFVRTGFYTDSGCTFTLTGGAGGTASGSGDGAAGATGYKYLFNL